MKKEEIKNDISVKSRLDAVRLTDEQSIYNTTKTLLVSLVVG